MLNNIHGSPFAISLREPGYLPCTPYSSCQPLTDLTRIVRPMPPKEPTPGDFQFVHISHPDNAPAWKKKVRSHAARNSRVRQKRVADHQSVLSAEHPPRDELLALTPAASPLSPHVAAIASPQSVLGAARTDPFDSFARRLSPLEGFLLDHCRWGSFHSYRWANNYSLEESSVLSTATSD